MHESDPTDRATARVRRAKKAFGESLRGYPNVTGVGVGYRVVGGIRQDEICLRVYVRRKLAETDLSPKDILPKSVNGVVVDVIEADWRAMAPDLTLQERRGRYPIVVPAGVSIGGLRVTAGTLGALVSAVGTGEQLLLSNWHVLCGDANCRAGEIIVQPGVFDGGLQTDAIAHLRTFALSENVDAACATVGLERYVLRDIAGLPGMRGVGSAMVGMRVWKSGRTTGVTTGLVEDVSADVDVAGYPGGIQSFRDQIIVAQDGNVPIVLGGDSGSLVVDASQRAVGLLFGGEARSGAYFIANHISEVIEALRIELPCQVTQLESIAPTT